MFGIILFLSLLGLFSSSAGQILLSGQCNEDITLVTGFDISEFEGTWYEVARSPNPEHEADCSVIEVESDNETLTFHRTAVNRNFFEEASGSMLVNNDTGAVTLNFSDGTTSTFSILSKSVLHVLGYRCINENSTHSNIYLWQFGNSPTVPESVLALVNTSLNTNFGIDNSFLQYLDHSDDACYILPVIDPGQPIVLPGTCDPNISVVSGFDVGRYIGVWHEIASYVSESALGVCARAEYGLTDTSPPVSVSNTQVFNQRLETISGTADFIEGSNGEAKLNVRLEVEPGVFVDQELFVLATDYANYAISYSCININETNKRVFSWILGRSQQFTSEIQNTVNQVIDSYMDLNRAYYQETARTDDDCFYYPEPVPGESVIFRGQCDMDIPVVPNFNATAYMGLWHDIESYPSVFQAGVCNNAFYTLNTDEGVVEVFNTQVIGDTLDTISGVAVIASDDGSAKLQVSFPIEGTNLTTQTDYWVLATDYTSYSLVYTCVNINAEQRLVYSWKLSRRKQLSPEANATMNAVISNINVLDQMYYVEKDQSEEGCFYYPEPRPGVPVIFPGRCDSTVSVVTNFNMTQFSGTWYEVEAYPKDDQTGQCVSHSYTTGTANTLDLQSSSITNQFIQISNSTVSFENAAENNGKLVITLNSDGEVITIPFWILNTDYRDYALAYSCVDLENDNDQERRAVYSWKLSRSQNLSVEANNVINNHILDVQVLNNSYYEPIDQSDRACFYLPELGPGEPIILPGQCDPDIAVVQNFNATGYEGLWHLIETYPSEFQTGTCSDATYTIQDDGSVLVFNTQVINQTLDTITGSAVLATTDGSAKLLVIFPDAPFPSNYWVLDTDYESYSLVYSCVDLDSNRRRVYSWKLSRTKSLSTEAVAAINAVISEVEVLNNQYFEDVSNTDEDCFYFPVPDGNPVVFRGQCDETIPVVTNFDAVAYEGIWYDIESYPQVFQDGTCPIARYTLTPEGVDVFNTQVIGETLDTIEGTAVLLPSTDGSAKLTVSFPIAGTNLTTQSPYWVLDTDYNSYSLVYSCVNMNSDSRYVSSWKLSRNKTLSAGADTAINNAISNVQVLQQDYYSNRNHTDEGCFYFPEPVSGQPVVFPGQCDNNIQAAANFNLSRFSGLWHEIESYPKDQQSGHCVNYLFDQTSNTALSLENAQVIDQELNINLGSADLTSVDGSGRLLITINVNGSDFSFPYWVIDTDYDNYALVYSCINIDDNYRGVWSWKLSRSKELDTAAATAINQAMSDIQVLEQRYYEPIDQSDNACFYYPVLGPNDPVVFVGQCDQNISVVQNFNATQFAGRWFDIESYFDDYNGSCIDGTFTQTTNGYDVLFTQVVEQALDSTSSHATVAVDGSGKLIVTTGAVTFEYWILDTDYMNYALVYSCSNLDDESRRVRSWKMSRTRALTNDSLTAIDQVVNTIDVLDQRYFNTRDHSREACFYYPQPVAGQPVTFRWQCDETISVVQNFNVTGYLGLWFDIESYPQQFQGGTCATATYSLGEEGVDVFNTQVINQQLDTINGVAVIASDDGSAKLLVSFPIAGTNMTTSTPYWVLATDYDSYSLVYSCSNIDDEYSRVTVWKLSRERNLSSDAQSVINNVMNTVPVIRQQYFEDVGHSEDDCFYYPDNFGGPVILNGQCPQDSEVDVVANLNITAFSGTWHEVSRFPSELQTGECASKLLETTGTNAYTLTKSIVFNERLNAVAGPAVVSTDGRGIIDATLGTAAGTTNLHLYILDTDYSEFALMYSCVDLTNDTKQIYSWKLSRSRAGLSPEANARIDEIVSSNVDLFEGYYEETDQSNNGCFHYPEFDPLPDSIELPGPCDESIRGIPNFNVNAYLGRWFEIAKYPQPFQFGTCDRAEYSLGDDAVVVYNTQVVNQTLDVMIGSAVVASDDNSGVLDVTFVVNGVTNVANYYILDTDYTSYSLVYSCRNLDNGNRQVTSWKLSRNRTLSNEANAVMDTIIQDTQGLLEDYYTTTSQSDEDCFYVPEVNENAAPVFRGQCADVTGVNNFNIQSFLGWWHEIERYPSDNDVGVCLSSYYQPSGTGFVVVETNVFGLTSQVNTSTVVANNNGRLTKTLSSGESIDIWVLATDYDNYALLYSCENINDEYRRVWSAKYSKARSLTAAAQAAIAPIIDANEVLYPQFYLPVDQSDEACFHYPEQTGQQIIIPGQCDANIPVVQNFDAIAYSGTWYQMERYPQIHESGSCVGARYTVNEDTGVVTVLNWEVIDGELETIEGTAVISSDDGSAKLTVSLPIAGTEEFTETELYVLTTDYASYSLAYSCVNVNQFQRAVGAWKISRTRTMPDAGNNAINAYMAQREELHQPYFIQTEQNEECAEPASSHLVKSSIIVLLICAIIQLLK